MIKSDLVSTICKGKTQNQSQFIQYHLRKYCTSNGASLIYNSAKMNINI